MDSARHSAFTLAQPGVWRKLADDRLAMRSRCCWAEIGRSVRGVVTPDRLQGTRHDPRTCLVPALVETRNPPIWLRGAQEFLDGRTSTTPSAGPTRAGGPGARYPAVRQETVKPGARLARLC